MTSYRPFGIIILERGDFKCYLNLNKLDTIYLNLRRQGHTDKEPKMINLYNLIKHISNLDFDIKHGVDLNASDLKICKMASKLDPKTNTLSKVNEILEVFNK